MLGKQFTPKLFDTLKKYKKEQFFKDLQSGLIVGIIASMPLSIAFGIASGVSPEKGLITAIIGGLIIAILGGSNVQISGPTGAFIIIISSIVQQFGIDGLLIATFLAGMMLIMMGVLRLGAVIKFIPYPIVVGFTAGIAVSIFTSQIKDLLGVSLDSNPVDFVSKWGAYIRAAASINVGSVIVGIVSILIIIYLPKFSKKIPGSLLAILIVTISCFFLRNYAGLHLAQTVGDHFNIVSALPKPTTIPLNMETIKLLLPSSFTIAMLCAIQSLLSATVADGVTGDRHNSNTELIAQGVGNMVVPMFGGIPVTGAIARTMANVSYGAKTPVAAIVNAITVLLILLFLVPFAKYIPMACLAGVLIVVSYNMSDWRTFRSLLKNPRSDVIVLLVTFFLTVVFDLTIAIEIGMMLAAFLFIRDIGKSSSVQSIQDQLKDLPDPLEDELAVSKFDIPKEIEVYEINGPLFFGAAYKFRDFIREIEKKPQVLILRMRSVPFIDATGVQTLKDVLIDMQKQGVKVVLSGVTNQQILDALQTSRITFLVGKANIKSAFPEALEHAKQYLCTLE